MTESPDLVPAEPNTELRAELARRAELDRRARAGAGSEDVLAVDADNREWLRGVIEVRGWPLRSSVGEEGAHQAWLLVQHADGDPEFQRRCLELMAAAAEQGEASPTDVAYLTDRVLLAQRRPQIYGTQVTKRSGAWVPRRLADEDDAEAVDARRAAVGLGPLADYLATFDPDEPGGTAMFRCQGCDSVIEIDLPEPAEPVEVTCAACGLVATVTVGPLDC